MNLIQFKLRLNNFELKIYEFEVYKIKFKSH